MGPVTGPITGTINAEASQACDCVNNFAYQPITVESKGCEYSFSSCQIIDRNTMLRLRFDSFNCSDNTTPFPIIYASMDIDYVLP